MKSSRRLLPSELATFREGLSSPKLGPWACEAIKQVFAHLDILQAEIDDYNRAITDHGDDLPEEEGLEDGLSPDVVKESFDPGKIAPGVEIEEGI